METIVILGGFINSFWVTIWVNLGLTQIRNLGKFRNTPPSSIPKFLGKFRSHQSYSRLKKNNSYINQSTTCVGECDIFTFSGLLCGPSPVPRCGHFCLNDIAWILFCFSYILYTMLWWLNLVAPPFHVIIYTVLKLVVRSVL